MSVKEDLVKRDLGRVLLKLEALQAQLMADPAQKLRMDAIESQTRRAIAEGRTRAGFTASGAVITIPVVVHVLYNTAAENISNAQVPRLGANSRKGLRIRFKWRSF